MPSPLQHLKKAIQTGNWSLAAKAYTGLTGQHIKPPVAAQPSVIQLTQEFEAKANELKALIKDFEAAQPQKPKKPKRRKEPDAGEDSELTLTEDEEELAEPAAPVKPRRGSDPAPAVDKATLSMQERARAALDQFVVEQGTPKRDDGSSYAPPLPWEKGKHTNEFKDDGKLARADSKLDRKLQKGLKPTERRPPTKLVKVQCATCGTEHKVPPEEAYRKVEGDPVAFRCNRCIRRAIQ